MTGLRSLPRHRSDGWLGGFVVEPPAYTSSIAANGGTVIAASEYIYRVRPGGTQLQRRDTPAGHGDVDCVAVEPRGPGKPARFAVATARALHIFDDPGVASVKFPEDHGEIRGLMWAPRSLEGRGALGPCLHVLFDEFQLLLPGRKPGGSFVRTEWPAPHVSAMASDGAAGVAFAVFDEENWELDVYVLTDIKTDSWHRRSIPAPTTFDGARIAVAGKAAAVSFGLGGGVWLTRDHGEQDYVELEQLRGLDPLQGGDGGGAIAFEGASADAALFAVVRESKLRSAIVRVEATGRRERIAELEIEGNAAGEETPSLPMIQAMAWDATRRTLWSAGGHAGVMCSTAPGAPVPFGEKGAARGPS